MQTGLPCVRRSVCAQSTARVNPTNSDKLLVVVRTCGWRALPGCRRCRWHWRKALQVGLRTGHSALQCRGRPLHWPTLGTAVPAHGPALGTHQCPVPAIEWKWALECRPEVRQVPLFRSKKALNRARKPAKSDLMLEKARPDFSDNICIHFFS